MPKVSVIVPAYNSAQTILETIDSVLKQTFTDFELIIIDDGSTDNTLELLATVQDSRLQVYSYENGGLPVARNRGLTRSQGEFISFIDADDLWSADKLELQLAALLSNPNAGVAYSWTLVMDRAGSSFYPGKLVSHQENVSKELLCNNFIASGSNVMLRRTAMESIGEFDPTLKSAEDWDYWLRLALSGVEFVVVPKAQIFYRQSGGAMSSQIAVMEKYNLMVVERAYQIAPPELQYLKRQSKADVYLYMGQLSLIHNHSLKQTWHKLSLAFRLYPQIALRKKFSLMVAKMILTGILPPRLKQAILQIYNKMRTKLSPSWKFSTRAKI